MKPYANAQHSGAQFYETGPDFIIVRFTDGSEYLYNYDMPGRLDVENMKRLAKAGEGLATYISQHVQERYAERLN